MNTPNQAGGLHQEAASEHEAVAKHHKNAIDSLNSNRPAEAKDHAKKALDACNCAQTKTQAACESATK